MMLRTVLYSTVLRTVFAIKGQKMKFKDFLGPFLRAETYFILLISVAISDDINTLGPYRRKTYMDCFLMQYNPTMSIKYITQPPLLWWL